MKKITNKSALTILPTKCGEFEAVAYRDDAAREHLVLVKGRIKGKSDVLVRVHSQCLTGDTLGSLRCDCGEQLQKALQIIAQEGGVLVYLQQEGRGIGLLNKIKAYALQDKGMDTVEANLKLGFSEDDREYVIATEILKDLGVSSIRLLTNNPRKIEGLRQGGIVISGSVPVKVKPNRINAGYLRTKQEKLGHHR
ncbi:GTP cyclohydrolase II [Candidatus Woesearchaeota archaeon]|nr:GTP cyclohydrolase II [Candidatus Woesearchaeota archaeon]